MLAGSYGKMFSVMQSPFTLREAETKKGRCSVSNNGPLTFPRQLDVVVDAVFVDRTLMRSHHFGSAGKKIRNLRAQPDFLQQNCR